MTLRTRIVNLDRAPDPGLSVANYRELAEGYDASCRFITRVRSLAVDTLELRRGDVVFDVACGTGALLPLLAVRVGSRGRVVGIEHSPEMAAIARERIVGSGCSNVEIIEATAQDAAIDQQADALLFCFAHDVLQSPAAVENLFRMTKPGARVAAVGAKLIGRWWSSPVDAWTLFRARKYLTTYRGLDKPWAPLEQFCADLAVVRTFHAGTSYLAAGTSTSRRSVRLSAVI